MCASSHQNGFAILGLAALAFFSTPFGLRAEQGDIVITREVVPRVATRAPLAEDPNPRVSNPGLVTLKATGELSDGDFAAVSTGSPLIESAVTNAVTNNLIQVQRFPAQNMPHSGAARGAGQAGVAGQVNRSIQQGLRPLQQLGGR